ncbi:MAG: NUDIX domain-containing protein [bacterium]|nr:NUDIX domain-containing protein [bacterium]
MTPPPKTSPHDEWFEIVDEHGSVIGCARRAACHRNPALLHRVVHVLVLNSSGALYLQKRSPTKDVQPGKWDTSVGGHVNLRESLDAAAQRELAEELGIHNVPLHRLYSYIWESNIERELVTTYLCRYDATPTPDPHEIEQGRWWHPDEIHSALGTGVFTPNFEHEWHRFLAAYKP